MPKKENEKSKFPDWNPRKLGFKIPRKLGSNKISLIKWQFLKTELLRSFASLIA